MQTPARRVTGGKLHRRVVAILMQNLLLEWRAGMPNKQVGHWSLNAGLVAMNLVICFDDQGIGTNIILDLTNQKSNEVS